MRLRAVCNYVFVLDGEPYGCRNEAIYKETRLVQHRGGLFGRSFFYWCGRHKPNSQGGFPDAMMPGMQSPITVEPIPQVD